MKKIGLILEGGGMRGMFTTGVLDYFIDADIQFDQVMGVSAGACQGSCYISNQKGRGKDIFMEFINDERYCSVKSMLKTGDIFNVEFAYHTIPNQLNIFDHQAYRSSPMKFVAVSTNLKDGSGYYPIIEDIDKDVDMLRASASLPFVSRKVMVDDEFYLDGGIADPIPIKQSEKMGYEKNIVVLTQPWGFRKKASKSYLLGKLFYAKYPNFIQALKNRHIIYNDSLDYLQLQVDKGQALVLCPKDDLGLKRIEKDKDKLYKAYQLGYSYAKKNHDRISSFLDYRK